LRQLIKKARNQITICSCEYTTKYDFILSEEITNQLDNGVNVSIYGNKLDQMKSLRKNWKGVNELRVFSWNEPRAKSLFHIKAITIDNNHCYLGSANFSRNAMKNSVEWGIITHSTDLCLDLESYIKQLVDDGLFSEVVDSDM